MPSKSRGGQLCGNSFPKMGKLQETGTSGGRAENGIIYDLLEKEEAPESVQNGEGCACASLKEAKEADESAGRGGFMVWKIDRLLSKAAFFGAVRFDFLYPI